MDRPFADIGTDSLGLQVHCLGDLPFRSAFPQETNEHGVALGFGRRSIPSAYSGAGGGRTYQSATPENSSAMSIPKALASLTAVKTRKFRLPFSKSTTSLPSIEARSREPAAKRRRGSAPEGRSAPGASRECLSLRPPQCETRRSSAPRECPRSDARTAR